MSTASKNRFSHVPALTEIIRILALVAVDEYIEEAEDELVEI